MPLRAVFMALEEAPRVFDHMPSIKEMVYLVKEKNAEIKFKQKDLEADYVPWQSSRAPGTPPAVEAVFYLIDKADYDRAALWGKKYLGVDINTLLAGWELWKTGKVADWVKNNKVSLLNIYKASDELP